MARFTKQIGRDVLQRGGKVSWFLGCDKESLYSRDADHRVAGCDGAWRRVVELARTGRREGPSAALVPP